MSFMLNLHFVGSKSHGYIYLLPPFPLFFLFFFCFHGFLMYISAITKTIIQETSFGLDPVFLEMFIFLRVLSFSLNALTWFL